MSGIVTAKTTARVERTSILGRLEALAPILLVLIIVLWVAVVFAASAYKYETFGQGYDQVDFEQAIWNTTQGRIMEDSRFNFTGSVFGMDWMPMLFFFVPVYALIPSAHVLFFLQIVGSALGAVPLYWLARDRLRSKLAGVGAGVLYLLYPTLLHTALNPFQVRLFAVTLLLFAFYYFEKGNWHLFAAFALLAMLARTDVSLVVGLFGVYALLTRRGWPYIVGPLVVGFGYFALSTFVIVPSYAYPGAFSHSIASVGSNSMDCWPCGTNPIIAYYGHLGSSGPEILGYIVTHPFEVVGLMFSGPKIVYMLSLLLPLAFLPFLAPKPLVLALPILFLNLLSLRSSQFDYETHYSLLMIPGLLASTIYGADRLRNMVERSWFRRGEVPDTIRWAQIGALVMSLWALVLIEPYKNPIYKNPVARAFLFPEPASRIKAAHELIAMIGPEAKVAASSKLAPQLLPRRYIYNFPPAPYSPYNFGSRTRADYVKLDYILVDSNASALDETANKIDGKSGLEVLRTLPEWKQVAEAEGLLLFKRQ
ncbi:MAG TPA: DUF2079 domain-containing protein [Chloroflexia bacterium]|nr:DUF2079 domain-containing protein [Chloroflexia bacterium]